MTILALLLTLFLTLFNHSHCETCGKRLWRTGYAAHEALDAWFYITGGAPAKADFWPWAVDVHTFSHGHVCAGVLIGPDTVLTAAHCVYSSRQRRPLPAGSLYVLLGHAKQSVVERTQKQVLVAQVHVHPNFATRPGGKQDNDLAILKLNLPRPLDSTKFREVCLPTKPLPKPLPQPDVCIVYGWGFRGAIKNEELYHVDVPILSPARCRSYFPDRNTIDENKFCFGQVKSSGYNGKGSCAGDSGGPIICKSTTTDWTVYGIVSSGSSVCMLRPAVATDVYGYSQWIRTIKSLSPNSRPNSRPNSGPSLAFRRNPRRPNPAMPTGTVRQRRPNPVRTVRPRSRLRIATTTRRPLTVRPRPRATSRRPITVRPRPRPTTRRPITVRPRHRQQDRRPSTPAPRPASGLKCAKGSHQILKQVEITGNMIPIKFETVDSVNDCLRKCCPDANCKSIMYFYDRDTNFCLFFNKLNCEMPRNSTQPYTGPGKSAYIGTTTC